jgi:hypothetical protein
MEKRKYAWVRVAIVMQFLTAVLHSIGFVVSSKPANDKEAQLEDLMSNYTMDMGAGFKTTMIHLFFAVSACFTLLCLMGGIINWYLLDKRAGHKIIKGVTLINLIIFGICFVIMSVYTFLPPILSVGLIVLSLLIAYFKIPSHRHASENAIH